MSSPFAAWLKQRRRELDLTQEALVELVGVSVVTIAKLESGERKPSKQVAVLLANALQIPAEAQESFIAFARGVQQVAPSLAKPVPTRQATLPMAATPLLGRSAELAQIAHLLTGAEGHPTTCRLLTLTGPGGVGKTRLALQAATDMGAAFSDGAVFVSLVGIHPDVMVASAVAMAIASALGLTLDDRTDITTQLLADLHPRQLLLVLDNLEHLCADDDRQVAHFLEHVLARANRIKILGTSREPLRVHGEWVLNVQGLPVPISAALGPTASIEVQSSAVQLFLQAARRADVNFNLDDQSDDLAQVVQICRQVEGVPLAIELAAAWCATLRPAEIAAQIARDLDFLAAPDMRSHMRQSSMRAVFEQSWRLLDEAEQHCLAALSVFRGGFMSDAALAVADADLSMLARLQSRSLIRRSRNPDRRGDRGAQARFDVHELVRQFAAEQLSPSDLKATRNRHKLFYAFLLNGAEAALRSADQMPTLERLLADVDNIRAMWDWAVAQQDLVALNQAMRGVARLCAIQSWNEEAVARFAAAAALRHDAHTVHQITYQSWFTCSMGDIAGALALQQQVFARMVEAGIEDPGFIVEPYLFHALTLFQAGDYARAAEHMRRVVLLARHLKNPWFEGVARHALAFGEFMHAGELVHSFAEMTTAAALLRGEGDIFQAMYVWYDAARISIRAGRFAEAQRLLADCDEVAAKLENPTVLGNLAQVHGQLALALGQSEVARRHFLHSQSLFQSARASRQLAEVSALLASLPPLSSDSASATM